MRELDARHPTGVVLAVCVQVAAGLPVLSTGIAGSALARAAYQQVCSGEAMLALAATDAGAAGSDLLRLGTRIDIGEHGLLVDGEKRWITNARSARWLLVLGRHRPQTHFTSLAWALVPADAPGVGQAAADGGTFAGAAVGHLSFNAVSLTPEHLLGAPGRGLAVFGRHVTTERLCGALWASARARRVLSATRRLLSERPMGEATMWDNAAVRATFARCVLEWWRVEQLANGQATALDEPDALTTSMLLKSSVAEGLQAVLDGCARLHGADGYAPGGLAALAAESTMFGIAGGATDAMLAGVADQAEQLLARTPPDWSTAPPTSPRGVPEQAVRVAR
jgi:citronellyl-CoA dehydrogenase